MQSHKTEGLSKWDKTGTISAQQLLSKAEGGCRTVRKEKGRARRQHPAWENICCLPPSVLVPFSLFLHSLHRNYGVTAKD